MSKSTMSRADVSLAINTALFMIEVSGRISVSRLLTYLHHLDDLEEIYFPPALEDVFFKRLVANQHVHYRSLRGGDLGDSSELRIKEERRIIFNHVNQLKISVLVTELNELSYMELIEYTAKFSQQKKWGRLNATRTQSSVVRPH